MEHPKTVLPSIIKELWMFSKSGLPIMEFSNDKLDHNLLAGFISALKIVAMAAIGEDLKSFIINKNTYSAFTCYNENIIVLLKTSSKTKVNKIKKISDAITEIIENNLRDITITYENADHPVFLKIKEELEETIKISYL